MFLLFCSAFSFPPQIIPYPNEISVLPGQFQLISTAGIGYDPTIPQADNLAQFVAAQLSVSTGFALPVSPSRPATGIYFGKADGATEEYYLSMTPTVVQISGSTRTALFYGFQSLIQLFPAEILLTTATTIPWLAANVTIHDSPRLSWRGAMLDTSRHFLDVDTVKSLLDGISRYKMNVFHLHLTDDQGWRFESKKFPTLTQLGSTRDSSPLHWHRDQQDGVPYGPYFYTQDQIRDLIAYAHAREITIVPEIEMPGHCLSALASFQDFACTGGPFKPLCKWGTDVHTYCPGNDDALRFLEELLDEVMTVFDSNVIHVGGDEVSHSLWENCPKCQARMAANNLKTTDELQSWFIEHFAQYLSSKGKRCIGWDEILQGGLPDGTMVMSWRGTDGGIAAAALGHDVVMSPQQYLYLDHGQFAGNDPFEYISGVDSLHTVYNYNPTDGVEPQYQKYIIGIQGNLWTEYVWAREDLEWKTFPRIAAVAEVGWTQTNNLDWNSFLNRLANSEYRKLDVLKKKPAPISVGLTAFWEANEIPTKWVIMQWPLTGAIGAIGDYEIAFVYQSGANAMKINNVKLYVTGIEAGSDLHEGTAFDPAVDNIWKIHTIASATDKTVYMTANVTCVGGSDSNGKIYIYAA
jgi:hexosaminidase